MAITPHDSQVHELNETAAAILLACGQPTTGRAVVDALASRFDLASPGGASAEVADFLTRLVDAGLLVRSD